MHSGMRRAGWDISRIQIGRLMRQLVVLESTSHPGTTEGLLGALVAALGGLTPGTDFHLSFSPERVDPGNPRDGIRNTSKIVSGVTGACGEAASSLFRSICNEIFLRMKYVRQNSASYWETRTGKSTIHL